MKNTTTKKAAKKTTKKVAKAGPKENPASLKVPESERPAPVKISELSTISMVAGKEKKLSKVIHNVEVKQWVGIGWVTEGAASEKDYRTIPVAK